MGRSLQADILATALKDLKKELAAMEGSQKAFLARYRKARLHAFQLEFLAKFLRKSLPANQEIFERLHLITKDLEDRLGAFNETDEMLAYVVKNEINLSEHLTAAAHFEEQRDEAYAALQAWMKLAGWRGELTATARIAELLRGLEDLDNAGLRQFAAKKMAKFLRELQENVDAGEFNPKRKSGYVIKEVEPKVHELRREIRKIPMFAGYLEGLFTLTDGYKPPSKDATGTLKYYSPLLKSELAKSDFAKLPKPRVKEPLAIARPFFLGVTKFVSELGFAKDWAQNLEQLHETGVGGEINFDQLDVSLKDVFGRPEPFNSIAARSIIEIKKTQIFRHMSDYLEAQV